jgi:hypothetical protein
MDLQNLHKYLVCDPVTGTLTWKPRPDDKGWTTRFAGTPALNNIKKDGYKSGSILKKHLFQHRAIFAMCHGYWPDQVDHINGIKSDNRLINLRDVNYQQNGRNRKKASNNTSGVTGVCWYKPYCCWLANITVNRKTKHLGYFDNFDNAVAARKAAEKREKFYPNHGM